MRNALTRPVLCASLLLGACSTIIPPARSPARSPGQELVGRSLRVETSQGQVSTLHLQPGGIARAAFGPNEIRGRWQVQDRQLCFFWGSAPRECWPYAGQFRRGQPVAVTSDRGNRVRVTLQ